MLERIAELAKDKKIDGITDLRDESNRNGMRVVMELRRDVNAEVLLNNLYKNSQLQVSFGINMLALVNDKPETLPLKEMIRHYFNHQVDVLTRKTKFDLNKAVQREHMLKGFIIALDNIDDVIHIIRDSYDDTEQRLMETFSLSDVQAKAILAMQLRRLSGLERDKIHQELGEIEKAIAYYNQVLDSKDLQKEILIEDAKEIKEKYGDARRSEIDPFGDFDIEDEDLIPIEDVIIAVTTKGYVKRMNVDVYKTQNRGGRGKTGMKMNEDDVIDSLISTSTHDYLLFFTSLGRVYKIKGYKIPNYGRNSKGLPIVNLLNLVEGETLAALMSINNFDEGYLFFTTAQGIVKRTKVSDFQNIRVNGIRALSLRENDTLHSVKLTDGERDIIIGASNGKAIRFNEEDVRCMGRNAAGVRGISLSKSEEVIGVTTVDDDRNEILAITEFGYGKRTDVDEYRLQIRGGKGVKTINVTEKNGNLKKLISVVGDEDLLVISDKGVIIRVPIDQIAQTKRSTQGVRIINLMDDHTVGTIAIVAKEDDEEFVETVAEGSETIEALPVTALNEAQMEESVKEYKHFSELSLEDELSDEEDDDTIDDILSDSY